MLDSLIVLESEKEKNPSTRQGIHRERHCNLQ